MIDYLVGAGFLLDSETVFSGQVATFRNGIVRLLKRHPQQAVIKVIHLQIGLVFFRIVLDWVGEVVGVSKS